MKTLSLQLLFLLIKLNVGGQCVSTGFVNGSTFSTDNTVGVYNFSSPVNAQISDNIRSSAASLIAILSGNTYYLKATGFNFNIPSYASICGITVEIESRATGLLLTAAVRDNEVRLIKGGIITGNNYAKGSDWGSSDGVSTYGSSNDLWGTTLTPADVNASNFGVAVSARIIALVAALPDAEIDNIRMKVDYNPILPVHLSYFTARGDNNSTVMLEWMMAESEDNAYVTLQRSNSTRNDWQNIQQYKLSNSDIWRVFRYNDQPLQSGLYAYRLKMQSSSGSISYSDIQYRKTDRSKTISVYPNPASDYIIIDNIKEGDHLCITNDQGKKITLVPEIIDSNSVRIVIAELPRGLYIIQSGNAIMKFMKQ